MMCLAYMHKYGEPFVDLIKDGTPEENASAWKVLREQIKQIHSELKSKLQNEQAN